MPPFAILIAFSGLRQAIVSTGYNRRVEECMEAATVLLKAAGRRDCAPFLGNVAPEEYAAYCFRLSGPLARRAEHFFSESERVRMGVDTLDRLERLTQLYRRGYRSTVIDQVVGKLIALEVEQCRAELRRLKTRLATYERQYDMPSDEFYRRFQSGDLGDDMDFVEWSAFWDMFHATQRRLDELAAGIP